MDLALDADGDLDLSTGDARLLTGLDAIAQHVRIRFRFIRGEWHLNLDEGVPYFEDVFVVGADLGVIESLCRQLLLTTPGVTSIVSLELTPDYAARTLEATFEAQTVAGTFSSADYGPFVLTAGSSTGSDAT